MSFTVAAGQVVAIVGLSGAGKTTLVNLIPRFYDVTAGAILIDGIDIRDVTLESLRAQIGIVTQETVLFDETHRQQHRLRIAGRDARARSRRRRAPRTRTSSSSRCRSSTRRGSASAASGCRAASGSGWRSRGRCSKNSPILILDEATSSLDAESERLVQEALANLMRDRTSFVIAHRLSTVRRADAIIVLERGRVAEIGRHEELLARPGGVYAKLYALQIFERRSPRRPAASEPTSHDQEHDRLRVADPRRRGGDDHRDRQGRSTTGSSICSCACRRRSRPLETRLRALVQRRVGARPRRGRRSSCSSGGRRRSTSS